MISQNENGDESATTRSAIGAGTITVTDGAKQTQDVASLSRDTTDTNGTVSNTPDVDALLSQQADLMNAAQAAGQVVAQGVGAYADMKRDEALAAGDKATADSWDEGGANRVALHVVGGALIGGLGGGNAFGAIGGAAGAGLTSAMAGELDSISKGVESSTGSELLGNISANIVAGIGGALAGGTAGAATGSAVQLYNQGNDKRKSLVSQVCPAGAQCSDATLSAAIQAQTDLNSTAQDNVRDVGIAGSVAAAGVGAAILGPEALAAYKAAQTGYSLATAALTGATSSAAIYTFITAVGAGTNSGLNPIAFANEFSNRFSLEGLAVTAAYGAASSMFGTQMYNWAGVTNSLKNITTAPGIVTRLNSLALGQTLGRAVKSPTSNHSN
jgi:filamentous hemagglutinin